MAGFGYKMAWLAVQMGGPTEALRGLPAEPLEPIDWPEGLHRVYRGQDLIVATPALTGVDGRRWVLIVGWSMGGVDVVGLSVAMDCEVQLFSTHRVVETHRWERAVGDAGGRELER